MKKVVLVLLFILMIINFSINSYALDFRGLQLGMTIYEVCKWIERNSVVSGLCDSYQIKDVQNWAEKQLIGDGVNYANVLISDNKVQKIFVSIYQDSSEAYRQALHKKYSKPINSTQVPYINNFGLRIMGLEEYWKIGKEHLWFICRPKSLKEFETYLVFITDEWLQLENKKTEPKL